MSAFRRLSFIAVLLCFTLVVLGAYVRLSHAGLGCPDWPGCYGQLLVPDVAHPDYERPLEHAKAWKEMAHRYLASGLGFLIIVLAFLSRRIEQAPRRLPWALVALVVFQGLLGMWTVTLLLKPLFVTAHLLGGMATLALLLWMYLGLPGPAPDKAPAPREPRNEREAFRQLQPEPEPARSPLAIRAGALIALVLLLGQIFLGGWTSSNYAALACPDLPTCHGQWLPELDATEAFTLWRGLGVNYEHGVLDNRARVTIHFLHRVGALVLSVALLVLGALLWRQGGRWRPFAIAVWMALGIQASLGVAIVWLQLPLPLAAAHNGGAALLLLVMTALNQRAWARSA